MKSKSSRMWPLPNGNFCKELNIGKIEICDGVCSLWELRIFEFVPFKNRYSEVRMVESVIEWNMKRKLF
jgi:hypothetical protein